MPRVISYFPFELDEEVNNIIEAEKARGATKNDINKSSLIAELTRLGIMVYKAQNEEKKEVFNVESYRKSVLRHGAQSALNTDVILSVLLGMEQRLCHGQQDDDLIGDYISQTMVSISETVNDRVQEHFSELNEEE